MSRKIHSSRIAHGSEICRAGAFHRPHKSGWVVAGTLPAKAARLGNVSDIGSRICAGDHRQTRLEIGEQPGGEIGNGKPVVQKQQSHMAGSDQLIIVCPGQAG